jgi:hypothetical protein
MISSEVQRTLVKSPPELWAELSDPASLARHLGELGEIRITRIEPERTVEWEAENTSGKVQIKASGWGTKVTLSVTREVSDDQAATASAGEAADQDAAANATPPDAERQAQPALEGEDEARAALEGPAEPVGEAAGAQSRPGEEHPTDDQPEPHGEAPAIAAEPFWPMVGGPILRPQTAAAAAAQPQPAPEEDLEPLEPGPEDGEEAPGRFAWMAYESEEPQPRRGFFARLLGRRRRPEPTDIETPGPLAGAEPAEDPPAPIIGAEQASEALDAEDPAEVPQPSASSDAPGALYGTAGHPLDGAGMSHPPDAPDTAEHGGPPGPPEALEHTATPAAPHYGDAPGGPQATTAHDTEPRQPAMEHQPPEISAELKAAEELATAEVTAVLTSVLDRLGAAHHRPFSRS